MVDARLYSRAQHGDRLVVVARRTHHSRTGKLRRSVADTPDRFARDLECQRRHRADRTVDHCHPVRSAAVLTGAQALLPPHDDVVGERAVLDVGNAHLFGSPGPLASAWFGREEAVDLVDGCLLLGHQRLELSDIEMCIVGHGDGRCSAACFFDGERKRLAR